MSGFDKILVLDFGSQYTQLIARRIRELNVYSEIQPYNYSLEKIKEFQPKGIILSGGPSSVLDKASPRVSKEIFNLGVPILGICYGMQLTTLLEQGEVEYSDHREYGKADLIIIEDDPFFNGFDKKTPTTVWMSHGDRIKQIPDGYKIIAKSDNSPVAAFKKKDSSVYGVQFHPEVVHTKRGKEIINNFVTKICKATSNWTMSSFIRLETEKIKKLVGDEKVILGLSGGVDSSVVAYLLNNAIGENLYAVFVDNGLLRKDEAQTVINIFKDKIKNFIFVDAKERFLTELKGITDPEQKRKIIGREFINVFDNEAKKLNGIKFLAQGTLYPDVIESVSFKGPSATIKSHHNVGGLPEKMNLKLIEPLRELFKDEVRELGIELGIPDYLIKRHPFPGPGLAIRIIGEITEADLELLKEADAIVTGEIDNFGWHDKVWQAFAVLLPVKSVGVMGDERTYDKVIAVRAVDSIDGMTANWVDLPFELLNKISNRIVNEIKGINRVVYDISSKPPSTIEWE